MGHSRPLSNFYFYFQYSLQQVYLIFGDDWIRTKEALVSEATALPTEPQRLTYAHQVDDIFNASQRTYERMSE